MDIQGPVNTSKLDELKNGNPSQQIYATLAFRDDILAYLDSKFNKVFEEIKETRLQLTKCQQDLSDAPDK